LRIVLSACFGHVRLGKRIGRVGGGAGVVDDGQVWPGGQDRLRV
jgi:hypothetical protein